jgi:hypothetical protein
MRTSRTFALGALLVALLVLVACSKKVNGSEKACKEYRNETPDSIVRQNPLSYALAVAQAADDADAGPSVSVKSAAEDMRAAAITAAAASPPGSSDKGFHDAEQAFLSACSAAGY